MKGKYLTFFLIVGLASLAVNSQNKTGYKDFPDKKQPSIVTSPTPIDPNDKTLDNNNPQPAIDSQGKSKTRTVSTAVRVLMGMLGVVCYELKECRESLNVQPPSASTPSQTTQAPYTFSPRFDVSKGKYKLVAPDSLNTGDSSVNSKAPSFYYSLAPDWSASPNKKAGKVTIRPNNQGVGGELETAIILGVKPISSGDIYAEAKNYVNGMVEANTYLANSNDFKEKTVGNKQCYYKQFFGFSKDVNANETVTFFGCKLNQNTMFYSVLVYNDKTNESDKQKFWQVWNSVEFTN